MIRDLPKSLIDAVISVREASIIKEVKFLPSFDLLDSAEKREVERLSKDTSSEEMVILDIESRAFRIIPKHKFDSEEHAAITEGVDKESEAGADHDNEDEDEEKAVDKHHRKRQHGGIDEDNVDLMMSSKKAKSFNENMSPPHPDVTSRRGVEYVKHADVIYDYICVGNTKMDGFRVMYYQPNVHERASGALTFFPRCDDAPAPSLEELRTLCLEQLPEHESYACISAIEFAMVRPHELPQYTGNEGEY